MTHALDKGAGASQETPVAAPQQSSEAGGVGGGCATTSDVTEDPNAATQTTPTVVSTSNSVATPPQQSGATGSLKHDLPPTPTSSSVAAGAQDAQVVASVMAAHGKGKGTTPRRNTTNQAFATSKGWNIKPL